MIDLYLAAQAFILAGGFLALGSSFRLWTTHHRKIIRALKGPGR